MHKSILLIILQLQLYDLLFFHLAISCALMLLLDVDHGPVPGVLLVQSFRFSFPCVSAMRAHAHICVCVCRRCFFLYCWPAFSCRPKLKNLSIRKKCGYKFSGSGPTKNSKKRLVIWILILLSSLLYSISGVCTVYLFIYCCSWFCFIRRLRRHRPKRSKWRRRRRCREKTHSIRIAYMWNTFQSTLKIAVHRGDAFGIRRGFDYIRLEMNEFMNYWVCYVFP